MSPTDESLMMLVAFGVTLLSLLEAILLLRYRKPGLATVYILVGGYCVYLLHLLKSIGDIRIK